MSIQEINAAAKDLIDIRAMIAELEAQAEALTDKLKGAMVDQGTETLQGDGWRASWKNVNSRRFDSKAFKVDHADLYSQYMMDRQNGAEEFQKVKQAAPLEIDQALFEDYDLLAADLDRKSVV